jgi:ribose 5-phosphate isomerase B
MKVYFAADHAGFDLKKILMPFVQSLGHEVEDCGAFELEKNDDYPGIVACAARAVSDDVAQELESRAIIIGGSGQGEAMAANRFKGVRAAVYYGPAGAQTDAAGEQLDMLVSSRRHNNANVFSLAARFMSAEAAQSAVKIWLETPFSAEERHVRRIQQLDALSAT